MSQWLDAIKFGDGHNGSPAVSGTINTYAACTGAAAATSLTTALSASAGDVILIHQSQGTGAGQWEINYVLADAGATLTLAYPLAYTYGTGAQAVLVPQYTGGTLNGAVTATSWGGSVGGIIALMSNGDLTISGSVSANAIGYRGSSARASAVDRTGGRGECTTGFDDTTESTTNNVNGGGGGQTGASVGTAGGGGGGGNGAVGTTGATSAQGRVGGTGGSAVGIAALTNSVFGGGGGSGGQDDNSVGSTGAGGRGGGLVFIFTRNLTVSGSVVATGANGANSTVNGHGGGGGGAGGSVLIKCQTGILGTTKITSSGGTGGTGNSGSGAGGAGAVGRIHIDYSDAYTGTTSPAINATQVVSLKSQVYSGMI